MSTSFATFNIHRQFTCSQDRLWHLLTDPTSREAWGGPADDHVLHVEHADVREGGEDLHRCGPAEAPEYTVATRWYRLDAPNLACFTETVDAGGARIATTLCTYTVSATDTGVLLDLDVAVSSFVGPEALADFESGWTSALARLEDMTRAA